MTKKSELKEVKQEAQELDINSLFDELKALSADDKLTGLLVLATTKDGKLHSTVLPGQTFGVSSEMFELHKMSWGFNTLMNKGGK